MALIETGKILATAAIEDHVLAVETADDFVVCKGPEKLKVLLKKIVPGNCVFYLSDGDWSMHDLVMELLKKYQPADVYITTYALREYSVRQLILAIDRKEISSVNMILDYRAPVRTESVYQMAAMNFNKIFLTSIHAKVTVISSPQGNITITGSANWTKNPKIESGVVTMSDPIANWYIENIKNIMDNAKIFE